MFQTGSMPATALAVGGELQEHLLQAGAVGSAELGDGNPGSERCAAHRGNVGTGEDGLVRD
jgi:hypothetical protein